MSAADTIAALAGKTAVSFNRGIEREALRVSPGGNLSEQPHPAALGSKLTHPLITTDFSEAQLELITGVHTTAADALAELDAVHRYVYSALDEEILWAASMPCVLAGDDDIPLAYYGESNIGRLKTTYRSGLGLRYGRAMQTICAIHYNFSVPDELFDALQAHEGSAESAKDYRTGRYFDLMRNFRRWSWLLTYLFGASPAVCNSFIKGREHHLTAFDEGTAYLPNATSLRSGNLGYQSDTQSNTINICYNSLDNYVTDLARAICLPHAEYAALGVRDGMRFTQVNANVLQSEAEFYSSIRAKRVPPKGANFLDTLKSDGVQYIEVRLLDVNPYLPLGISEAQIHFLDAFLTWCLLAESPQHDDALCNEVSQNLRTTVMQGRDPDVTLTDNGTSRPLQDWAADLMSSITDVAAALDAANDSDDYSKAVAAEHEKLGNPDQTPAGTMLKQMQAESIPFFRLAMNQSLIHREHFTSRPLSPAQLAEFEKIGAQSITDHEAIEARDEGTFEDYLSALAAEYEVLAT